MSYLLIFLRWLGIMNNRCPNCLGWLNKSYLFDTCTECKFGHFDSKAKNFDYPDNPKNHDLGWALTRRYEKRQRIRENIEELRAK